jgi:hypothetical protein
LDFLSIPAGADDVDGAQPGRESGRRARRRIAWAKPRTSSATSPLLASAASSAPPIAAGSSGPLSGSSGPPGLLEIAPLQLLAEELTR